MARSSKKNHTDLNDLPDGWETKDDLVRIMAVDRLVLDAIKNLATLPGTAAMDFSDPAKGLMKNLFMGAGWQLTLFGCAFMLGLYKSYALRHESNLRINGRVLVNLGRIIRGPWRVHNHTVYVWDQHAYFELSMFDGDIHRYVDFNAPK